MLGILYYHYYSFFLGGGWEGGGVGGYGIRCSYVKRILSLPRVMWAKPLPNNKDTRKGNQMANTVETTLETGDM